MKTSSDALSFAGVNLLTRTCQVYHAELSWEPATNQHLWRAKLCAKLRMKRFLRSLGRGLGRR